MVTNTITGFLDRFDGATATTWYGLVPNSVKRVIVSYASGPKTTVTVVDNTFLVHLHGPMQQCMTRRAAREAVNLSTTAKTLTAYCRN
jgi:Flp pilus assembly pilin Flp